MGVADGVASNWAVKDPVWLANAVFCQGPACVVCTQPGVPVVAACTASATVAGISAEAPASASLRIHGDRNFLSSSFPSQEELLGGAPRVRETSRRPPAATRRGSSASSALVAVGGHRRHARGGARVWAGSACTGPDTAPPGRLRSILVRTLKTFSVL